MSKSRLSYMVLLVVLVSVRVSFGGSIVDPKIILEIQPSFFELSDYFTDAANQAMIDSGYIHLKNLEGTQVGDQNVTMEIIKGWLRSSTDYGILEYGGHGGDMGETGGETFSSETEADAKMQYLIDWRYFTAEELVIERNKVQPYYWIISMTPAFTSKGAAAGGPNGCDIAFVSTCNGETAGSFNALCKVFGSGSGITNLALTGSFSCMMALLVDKTYRTIPLAASHCKAIMSNPPFAFNYVCTD